jgi:serine/threonine protein kinase HipA of HipAB toxin-antitoxin module
MPPPSVLSSPQALLEALGNDALGAADLMGRLGCSQATLSREVRKAGAAVLTMGKAQRTRYARMRPAGVSLPLPIAQLNEQGDLQPLGQLYTVGMHTGSRTALESEKGVALFEGLPWFVSDMRPQGYLGRQFPQRLQEAAALDAQLANDALPQLPPSINDWSDDHVLRALDWAGHDEPGNLIVGRRALDLHLRQAPAQAVPMARKLERYAALAQESLNADGSMSSAAGEQPKFTQYVQTSSGAAHVIVKFSPADSGEAARRWRDLLRCEAHALNVLADHAEQTGVQAAQATVLQDANRVYLEVQRFDRVGARGRIGVISLGAADDHFVGQRRSWIHTAQQLALQRLLSAQDVQRIALLQAFGLLIHNNDMHLGNIALFHDGPANKQFKLAPIYDMLPMCLRPVGQELREVNLKPVLPQADLLSVWPTAQALATDFYARVRADGHISAAYKLLLNQQHLAHVL